MNTRVRLSKVLELLNTSVEILTTVEAQGGLDAQGAEDFEKLCVEIGNLDEDLKLDEEMEADLYDADMDAQDEKWGDYKI